MIVKQYPWALTLQNFGKKCFRHKNEFVPSSEVSARLRMEEVPLNEIGL